MRNRGNYELVKIAEQCLKALTMLRSRARQRVNQISRLRVRQYGIIARVLEVFGNPIHRGVTGAAKIFDIVMQRYIYRIVLLGCCWLHCELVYRRAGLTRRATGLAERVIYRVSVVAAFAFLAVARFGSKQRRQRAS